AVPAQAAAHVQAQAPASAAATKAAPTTYTVVAGDYLSKIAAERNLEGGWERLYADNRAAVGTDPSLIHPGLELTLGGTAKTKAGAKAEGEPKRERASRSGHKSAAPQSARTSGSSESGSASSADSSSSSSSSSASGSAVAAGSKSAAGFVAPVSAPISTSYRQGGSMWSSGYHTGVDFTVGSGTTVHAVGAGTVVSAGWAGSYGNEVIIRHADGHYSQYAHLSSLSVSSGQSVSAGDSVGLSGSTGNSTGPHLHFEIRTGPSYGDDIDPLAYLRAQGVSV
ncbi:LysM peptidoglycan-binding domain-containing M23 family metallopeptidase, partial [Streptomyces sp. 12297]